ncbi:MAG: diaminobutyrate acetyltransferase [Myxococcota bacterium]
MAIRPPGAQDAAAIWSLVEGTGSLDLNSPYAYLLLCTDFAGSGAVAEAAGEIVGFVLGYRPPARPDVYFVWQVAVRDTHRGRGLAPALIGHVLERTLPEGVAYLEATVTPSNAASRALFKGIARRAGVGWIEHSAFPSQLFPGEAHEEEVRIRIGPLDSTSLLARPS